MNDGYLLIYGLAILSIIITMGAQLYIKSSYAKYNKESSKKV